MALDKYRRDVILTTLEKEGRVRLTALAQLLDVSAMTIRRDLIDLERAGLLIRVHGGAVSTAAGESRSTGVRWTLNLSAKERIGAAVAQLIPNGSRVILDSGTTVAEVARKLRGRQLEVITSSLPAASILGDDPATNLTMLGGRVRPESLTVIGTEIEDSIQRFRADFAVLGTPGLSNNSFYSLYPSEVAAQRTMIASSATSLLVADRTKMGLRQGVRVGDLSELSAIVTDAPLDSSVGDDLPRIIVADPDPQEP